MSKIKTAFHCQECGAKYAKWQGQCNKCGSWNTISEEIVELAQVRAWNHMSSDLIVSKNRVLGVVLGDKKKIFSKSVVLTTGTFLQGLIRICLLYTSDAADE